jgi:hypothetical protein
VLISTAQNPCEISIAINPKDPSEIIAGAVLASFYTSFDGGLSWRKQTQKSRFEVYGDPVVLFDTAGYYYHFHLSNPPEGNWIDRIVCQRSIDKGLSFNAGTFMGLNGKKAQDKHWAVVDPRNNNIYVTWTQFDKYDSSNPADSSHIMFSFSQDGSLNWSDAQRINKQGGDCLDGDNTVEGAVPAVGPDGEIYVAWAGPGGLVFNKSLDQGKTWLPREKQITDIPGGWAFDIPGIYRANGLPITKCDLSESKYKGTIYVNWSDQRNGSNNTDIWLTKSNDKGETWSKPKRVNQDKSESHQFFTWMDVDPISGNLYFIYYDRRNHNDISTDVYLAYSTDGGNSFDEVKISESAFYPDSTVFFGDYSTIASVNDVIRPAWTRLDEKSLSVYTCIIDQHLLLNGKNSRLEVSFDKQFKMIDVVFSKSVRGDLTLYNINGKTLQEWNDIELSPEHSTFQTSSTLMPGVYTVSFKKGKKTYSRQLIVPTN